MMHQGVEVSLIFPADNNFQDVYYRTSSRTNGHRNIRCFPSCSSTHNDYAFCGRPLQFVINLMIQKDSVADYHKFDLESLCCVGEFRPEDRESSVPSFMLGSRLGEMIKTKRNANKNLYWGKKVCTYKQEEIHSSSGSFILYKAKYEMNTDLRGWQYPTGHNVRFRTNQQHVFTIVLFSPGTRMTGKKLSGINCGSVLQTVFKDDVFYPIAYFDTPLFSVGFCKTKLNPCGKSQTDKVLEYDLEATSDQDGGDGEVLEEREVEDDNKILSSLTFPDTSTENNATEFLENIKYSSDIVIAEDEAELQIPSPYIKQPHQPVPNDISPSKMDIADEFCGTCAPPVTSYIVQDGLLASSNNENGAQVASSSNSRSRTNSNDHIDKAASSSSISSSSQYVNAPSKDFILGLPNTVFQDIKSSFTVSSKNNVMLSLYGDDDDYIEENDLPINIQKALNRSSVKDFPESSIVDALAKSYISFDTKPPFDVLNFLRTEVLEKRRANRNNEVVISKMFQHEDYLQHLESQYQMNPEQPPTVPKSSQKAPLQSSNGKCDNANNTNTNTNTSSSNNKNNTSNISRTNSASSDCYRPLKQLPDDVDYFERLELLSLTTCFTDPSLAEIIPPPYSKGDRFFELFKKSVNKRTKPKKLVHFVQQFFKMAVTFPIALEPALYYLKMLHVANGKLVTLSHVNPIASMLRETSSFAPYFGLSRLQSLNTQACEELFEPLFLSDSFEADGYVSMTHKQLDCLMKNAVKPPSVVGNEEIQSITSSNKSINSQFTIETLIEWLDSEQGGSHSSGSHEDRGFTMDESTLRTEQSIQNMIDDDCGAILLINMISEYYSKDVGNQPQALETTMIDKAMDDQADNDANDGESLRTHTFAAYTDEPMSNPANCLLSLQARIKREEEVAESQRLATEKLALIANTSQLKEVSAPNNESNENSNSNAVVKMIIVHEDARDVEPDVVNKAQLIENEIANGNPIEVTSSTSNKESDTTSATSTLEGQEKEVNATQTHSTNSTNVSVNNGNNDSNENVDKDQPPWKRIKIESSPQLL